MAKDPVCGMEVKSPSEYSAEVGGTEYDFCSEKCKNDFLSNPDKYIKPVNSSGATYNITSGGIEKLDIPIIGIDCSSCIPTIESEIKKLQIGRAHV